MSATPPPPIQRRTFGLFFFVALLMLVLVLRPFWHLLVLALILTSAFHPVYKRLVTRTGSRMASVATCTIITLCVFIPLLFCILQIANEIPTVIQMGKDNPLLVGLLKSLQNNTLFLGTREFLASFGIHVQLDDIPNLIADLTKTVGVFVYSQVSAWATNIMRSVLLFCIMIMVVYYLLIEFKHLSEFLLRLSPLPERQNRFLISRFANSAGAILFGNTLSGVIQGVCGGVYFAVMGLQSPVLWGTMMAIAAFMPIVGVGLILLPTALILYLNDHGWQALITVAFYLLLTLSVDYFFKPRFVGGQAQLPPLLVLLSIIGGLSLFGIMGLIYGPLAVTAFLTLADMYERDYQPYVDQKTDNDS